MGIPMGSMEKSKPTAWAIIIGGPDGFFSVGKFAHGEKTFPVDNDIGTSKDMMQNGGKEKCR